jgi:hypothetical protein
MMYELRVRNKDSKGRCDKRRMSGSAEVSREAMDLCGVRKWDSGVFPH